MLRPLLRLGDQLGDGTVHRSPPVDTRLGIGLCRQEWMREPEDPRFDPQDAGLLGLSQSPSCNIRPDGRLDHANGRLGEGRGMQDHVGRSRRERPDPIPDQLRQAVRQRQVALIRRLAPTLHRARDLDGVERVSARGPVQPLERARWKVHLEHVAEEPLELRDGEAANDHALEPAVLHRTDHGWQGRGGCIDRSLGGDQPDRLLLEAAERELEDPGRRPVHPRDVVDRQQERAASDRRPKQCQDGKRDREGLGDAVPARPEQRGVQRSSLGLRKVGLELIDELAEQICQRGEREAGLGLGRA